MITILTVLGASIFLAFFIAGITKRKFSEWVAPCIICIFAFILFGVDNNTESVASAVSIVIENSRGFEITKK